ncbi:hypothetical protein PSTT_03927 [Puccinia striiformis]|uniref:Uncharacterized protein n=1 Tax=Puccinia striiformis TaxID=27350 RepID=A0A2S4VUN8_9BASI|nr:hypothetical protein PSTT_03927 [Puccinia striiformis]
MRSTMKRFEGTLDFKAAIVRQYPKGATPKKEVEVPTEGALNLPLEEQPNLLDVKKPGAHLTEEQKAEEVRQARLAEGRTYGPGGRCCVCLEMDEEGMDPIRKLVERFDNHVSKEELNTLKKAKEAQLLPPDLFPASSSDPIHAANAENPAHLDPQQNPSHFAPQYAPNPHASTSSPPGFYDPHQDTPAQHHPFQTKKQI